MLTWWKFDYNNFLIKKGRWCFGRKLFFTHNHTKKLMEQVNWMSNEQDVQLVVVYDFQMMIHWWNQYSDEKRHNHLLQKKFFDTHQNTMKLIKKINQNFGFNKWCSWLLFRMSKKWKMDDIDFLMKNLTTIFLITASLILIISRWKWWSNLIECGTNKRCSWLLFGMSKKWKMDDIDFLMKNLTTIFYNFSNTHQNTMKLMDNLN